jgi:hypothetical protein
MVKKYCGFWQQSDQVTIAGNQRVPWCECIAGIFAFGEGLFRAILESGV